MHDLATFLRNSRRAAGLSQGDVAAKLGYTTPQFVSNWERGLSSPPIPTLRKLAMLYKLDIEAFYNIFTEAKVAEVRREIYEGLFGKKKKSAKEAAPKKMPRGRPRNQATSPNSSSTDPGSVKASSRL